MERLVRDQTAWRNHIGGLYPRNNDDINWWINYSAYLVSRPTNSFAKRDSTSLPVMHMNRPTFNTFSKSVRQLSRSRGLKGTALYVL